MQTVPGQRNGEKRKEQLAVVKHPRARPALLVLRNAAGVENRSDAAIAATVRVVSRIVDAEITGGEETSIDESTVKRASMTPAASVEVALPGEVDKVLSDRMRDQAADVDVGEPDFEAGRDTLGSGGWRKRTEVARAIYPRTTFFNGV